MAIPTNINDLEFQKFLDMGGYPAVRTSGASSTTAVLPNLLSSGLVTFAALGTGAAVAHPLFTVSGVVAVTCFAVVGTDVTITAGAPTIEVGTALSTAGLIAQVAGTALDAGEIWHDATPDASVELDSVLTKKIVTQSISYLVVGNTFSGGTITFYCSWYPISPGAKVVAVSPVV